MLASLRSNKRRLRFILSMLVILVAIQFFHLFVPDIERTNPDVTYPIQWDSEQTEALVRAACMDCHSNETRWPWYAQIAPVAWLVARDVNEGRAQLNFSTGSRLNVREMVEVIREGEMPPAIYLPLHPDARLNDAEKAQLIAGLQATFNATQNSVRNSEAQDDDDD